MNKSIDLSERQRLEAEYYDIAKKELPLHIKRLPLHMLRVAVEQAGKGLVYCDPPQPKAETQAAEELPEWDSHDAKNSNAYGGENSWD